MEVTLRRLPPTLLGALTLTDAETAPLIQAHFQSSLVPQIPYDVIVKLLKHVRDYEKDGMSFSWMVNEIKAKQLQITGGAYMLSTDQIGAFITALKRIESGDTPTFPDAPSWSEAYSETFGANSPFKDITKYIPLALGGLALLYFGPGMLGRYQRARKAP